MLLQPEHILSLQLMEIESSLTKNGSVASSLSRTRDFLNDASRDVIDESDENFSVKFELVYTIVRDAVFLYVSKRHITQDEVDDIEKSDPGGFWADSTKEMLLLLRGLFAGGVLAFAFGAKRWRVNYGLAQRKPPTQLAVPYRAKDTPSPRSEFSQPDVVILLTTLSYYYSGLGDDDLFTTLDHLSHSDQAEIKYKDLVRDAPTMPAAFRQLEGINLKDRIQCVSQVFPHLKFAKSAVDYFLSYIVFPKEMKEFPHKLSASGWDLGKIKRNPTTGFSGTNDSRSVLPIDVKQLDLPEQRHTNALVLEYLLQPENSVAPVLHSSNTSGSDAERLLKMTMTLDPPVQVILDVGAQILELENVAVACQWLSMHKGDHVQAAVFVSSNDELLVINRKGHIELLQTSPYALQLDVCLVFLDEAHTRGIDLKLPANYRAAVTLGANLTKDRMIQACMRMRRLGQGQTVVFCVPQEIEMKIRECTSKLSDASIDISDVLCWTIHETWADARRSVPLWATQGQRFVKQKSLWNDLENDGKPQMSEDQAIGFLEQEAQSLEDRYSPSHTAWGESFLERGFSNSSDLVKIVDRCHKFGCLEFNSSSLQEEQERELSPEIERERQVQRPSAAKPARHELHPDVLTFVEKGVLVANSEAFMPAFEALCDTSAAARFDISQLCRDENRLLVTTEFARTVEKTGQSYQSDSYQRSVQWILTNTAQDSDMVEHMIIISPYEADNLLPLVKTSRHVTLHVYAPRWNLEHGNLDRLDYYTVPAQRVRRIIPVNLSVQLNLFAGQLYFSSFEEYLDTLVGSVRALAFIPAQ
ncbi:hypothetical protein MBLNU459_g5980t2 [Dothideomycetes sp. NU459]